VTSDTEGAARVVLEDVLMLRAMRVVAARTTESLLVSGIRDVRAHGVHDMVLEGVTAGAPAFRQIDPPLIGDEVRIMAYRAGSRGLGRVRIGRCGKLLLDRVVAAAAQPVAFHGQKL
jgi:hypothetical protein